MLPIDPGEEPERQLDERLLIAVARQVSATKPELFERPAGTRLLPDSSSRCELQT